MLNTELTCFEVRVMTIKEVSQSFVQGRELHSMVQSRDVLSEIRYKAFLWVPGHQGAVQSFS